MPVIIHGDRNARELSRRIDNPYASITELAATNGGMGSDGMLAMTLDTGKLWRFSSTCALTADNQLVVGSGSGTGRWLLMPGRALITLPITFATADAAILWTMPTGAVLKFTSLYWTITTSFTGGTNAAIGVSSTKTNFTTKGDLLGGAGGDVLAALTTALSPTPGTIGVKMDALTNAETNALWVATNTIRFDRVADAFTAGVGAVNIICDVLKNPGA
jgi:hypothetical protein